MFSKTSERKPKQTTVIHKIDVNKLVQLPPVSLNSRKTTHSVPQAMKKQNRRKNRKSQDFGPTSPKTMKHMGTSPKNNLLFVGSPGGPYHHTSPNSPTHVEDAYLSPTSFSNHMSLKIDGHKPVPKNETMLSEQEIKEYAFLNQAKSINIFEIKDTVQEANGFEEVDLNANNSEEDNLELAISTINNLSEYTLPKIVEALNMLFDYDFNKLKIMFDLGEAAFNICGLLEEGHITNHYMQKRMLAFLFYVCEDSMFSLNVDFNQIYYTICHFIIQKMIEPSESDDPAKDMKDMEACLFALNDSIAKNYYLLDLQRTTSIIQLYLSVISTNLEEVTTTTLLEALGDRNNGNYKSLPLISHIRHNGVRILYSLMKNPMLRLSILSENECHAPLLNIFNRLSCILKEVNLIELENAAKKEDRDSLKEVIVFLIKGYEFFLNTFKYYDMFALFGLQTQKLEFSLQEIINCVLSFYQDLFRLKNGPQIVFELSGVEGEGKGTTSIVSGLSELIKSSKKFFGNLRLYEEKLINFSEALVRFEAARNEIQTRIDSKTLSKETELFVESSIKSKFDKIMKMMQQNIELCK